MIYFESCSRGAEGWNTHVMSYTMCISLSNFLDRDFYYDYEIPSSRPPEYALRDEFRDKYGMLLNSPRSLVSELLDIPARRRLEVDRDVSNKASYELLYSYFATTEAIRAKFEGTIIWDSFGMGRFALTREELQEYDLVEWTHSKLSNVSFFYFLEREDKNALLHSVELRYRLDIEDLAGRIIADVGPHYSVHIRLSDFLGFGEDEYSLNVERFSKYVRGAFTDREIPVLVATDALYEKEILNKIFDGFRVIYIDELVFGEYREPFGELEFTDWNVLMILNQLLCASAGRFVGTYRSTVTGIIHRLRQERYGRTEFDFFPDERVVKLMSTDYQIVPDQSGFFDWNRYSIFAQSHASMAWMREWDFQKTSLS